MMRVLVATSESQRSRKDDFDWCLDGELVWMAEPCGRDRRTDARECGCGRAFAGLASHRSTTTVVVRDLPHLEHGAFVDTMRMSLTDQGWPAEWAEDLVLAVVELAEIWPEGTVLERHLDFVRCRFDPVTGVLLPPYGSVRS